MKIEDIKYFFKNIKYGIKNLIIWLPIIWKDRQWDHWFFYVILHKKLSLMEKFFRKSGIHTRAIQDADKIKICVLLLERLKEDNYFENAMTQHNKKWGDGKFNFEKIENSHCSQLNIIYENVKTESDEKEQRRDFKNASEKEQLSKQQDLDMLFNLVRKNIQTWWD